MANSVISQVKSTIQQDQITKAEDKGTTSYFSFNISFLKHMNKGQAAQVHTGHLQESVFIHAGRAEVVTPNIEEAKFSSCRPPAYGYTALTCPCYSQDNTNISAKGCAM